jgi:putative ABC transport system ATP-binding protein
MKKIPAISVRDITKDYSSGDSITRALDKISLDIMDGEFLMITGRNGSGKSTLMHLMALLDSPTSGQLLLNGEEVMHLEEKRKIKMRLRTLGYIFQEYALIQELTAIENVMLPALMISSFKDARVKAANLMKKVNLENKFDRLPSQLSGGEQQRVAIARSLINDPRIIFADEPTANLDSFASKEVLEIFKSLNEQDKITIVMVTHEPEELKYASRVINIKDGKINEE